ncbi:hypothetical protein [Streptomyces sp. NPDC048737]|uniref:hypothetical protein n=1 Tax=unclassified Streptomyces TaxID=2593676 RepID=UPI003443A863
MDKQGVFAARTLQAWALRSVFARWQSRLVVHELPATAADSRLTALRDGHGRCPQEGV